MTDEPLERSLPPIAIAAFAGPFDLLLHLIRVNEVSITDIPIAEITEQYTAYLDTMRELDLDIASEYVAMAAELIYIKSRMLLPRPPGAVEESPLEDLARRLAEYERYKNAAENLHEIDALRAGLWSRPPTAPPPSPDGETLEVSLFDLIGAFREATERYRLAHPPALEIRHQRFSVHAKMEELLARLDEKRTLPLLDFLGAMQFRAEAVTAFLAMLELVRLGVARAFQRAAFGEIHVTRTDVPFTIADVRDTYR
ncbi:MAG: segregation/condensation protein A [Acidobacteriota bacterium]|nr:segregation/condensation protein A [Acidobacteriota bacterium]